MLYPLVVPSTHNWLLRLVAIWEAPSLPQTNTSLGRLKREFYGDLSNKGYSTPAYQARPDPCPSAPSRHGGREGVEREEESVAGEGARDRAPLPWPAESRPR